MGYEAASTNRITAAFGGSKATLFRHYPSKEALLEAVIRDITARWASAVDVDGISAGHPEAWLAAFAERVLDWILGEEPLFVGRLAIAEGHKFPGLGHVFAETAGEPLVAVLAERLAAWTASGRLMSKPAADARHFLDLAVSGPVNRALYRQPPLSATDRTDHVAGAVRLFLDGCRKRRMR